MHFRKIFAAAAIACALTALPAAAADLWFHVTVNEHKGDNANITVNLPIALVQSALSLVPEETMRDGRIKIDDAEFDAVKLRQLWEQVKQTPDANFITVASDKETVKVFKENGYLVARTTERSEHGSEVHAKIPLAVVDALLSGDRDTLNLQAALDALIAQGEGELVTVNDHENTVRVWIDRTPEAR